jgi:TldD protein
MRTSGPGLERRRFLQTFGGAAAGGALALIHGRFPGRFLSARDARAEVGDRFPIDEAACARVLRAARASGAAFSELYLEHRVVTRIELADGRIESTQQGIFAGCGIRAVDGQRTGYAYADSFEPDVLLEAAAGAAAIASGTSGANGPAAFQPTSPPHLLRTRIPFDEVSVDQRVGWLRQADEAARAVDPAVHQVTVSHSDEQLRFAVVNSDGLWVEDRLPLLYLRINVVAEKNGKRSYGEERVSFRRGAEQMDGDAAGNAAREAARMAIVMAGAAPSPAGEMPVVLASGGGVLFHESVGHGLEADFAMRGTSFYTGRVGEKVASEKVSLIDTGALRDLRGSFNVDDEGTVPGRNVLIEKGTLRGFMTDRISSEALGLPRTGNGRRESYRHPPLVRMSNTFIEAGDDEIEGIIRETRRGLYARKLGGGEVDTTSGNFTFGVREGYLIEDGKIGAPVLGANLVGNGPEIMRRIDRVAFDLSFWPGTCGKGQWVPISSGAPTLRISSMTVGGSGGG